MTKIKTNQKLILYKYIFPYFFSHHWLAKKLDQRQNPKLPSSKLMIEAFLLLQKGLTDTHSQRIIKKHIVVKPIYHHSVQNLKITIKR